MYRRSSVNKCIVGGNSFGNRLQKRDVMRLEFGGTLKIISLLKTRVLAHIPTPPLVRVFIPDSIRTHTWARFGRLYCFFDARHVHVIAVQILPPLSRDRPLLRPFGNGFSAGYFSTLAATVIKRAPRLGTRMRVVRPRSRTRHAVRTLYTAIEYGRPIRGVIYWSSSAR